MQSIGIPSPTTPTTPRRVPRVPGIPVKTYRIETNVPSRNPLSVTGFYWLEVRAYDLHVWADRKGVDLITPAGNFCGSITIAHGVRNVTCE